MMPVFIIVMGISLALILPIWVHPLLARLGVVDVPNERSSHQVPTIRGMGVALAVAGCLTTAAVAALLGDGYRNILAMSLLGAAAAGLGFLEDLRGIRIAKRAALQVLIGACFGFLVAWTTQGSMLWVPVSALAVATYINAANFMDGINGISGLHGGVAGLFYAVLGAVSDRVWMVHLGLILAGIFLAFLPWNLSKRRVFLGDVGSYLLGAWVAGIGILGVASGLNPLLAIAPAVIYLADTGATLLRRIRRGERWFEAHRTHVYQQLISSGASHLSVALKVAAFSALTAAASLLSLIPGWGPSVTAAVVMALLASAYLSLPALFRKRSEQTVEVRK